MDREDSGPRELGPYGHRRYLSGRRRFRRCWRDVVEPQSNQCVADYSASNLTANLATGTTIGAYTIRVGVGRLSDDCATSATNEPRRNVNHGAHAPSIRR